MFLKSCCLLWVASLCLLFACTVRASPSSPNPKRFTRNFLYTDDISVQGSVINERFVRDVTYDMGERENCSNILNPPPQYNGSVCELVLAECDGKYELLNYLNFVTCGLGESLQVSTLNRVAST